ncbi:hypothetical protein [Sphaerisporangium sp. NPDC051011]|uniref:hypothetical protein n=1 Tax=Sphaerisporangium sp. NPDC051011 TaxID=3155792 RepID=UPI0034010DAA
MAATRGSERESRPALCGLRASKDPGQGRLLEGSCRNSDPDLTQAVLREVGPRLQAARLKRDLTLDALAKTTDIQRWTIDAVHGQGREIRCRGCVIRRT